MVKTNEQILPFTHDFPKGGRPKLDGMSIVCYPLELWLFHHYDLNMAINYNHYDLTSFFQQ